MIHNQLELSEQEIKILIEQNKPKNTRFLLIAVSSFITVAILTRKYLEQRILDLHEILILLPLVSSFILRMGGMCVDKYCDWLNIKSLQCARNNIPFRKFMHLRNEFVRNYNRVEHWNPLLRLQIIYLIMLSYRRLRYKDYFFKIDTEMMIFVTFYIPLMIYVYYDLDTRREINEQRVYIRNIIGNNLENQEILNVYRDHEHSLNFEVNYTLYEFFSINPIIFLLHVPLSILMVKYQ